MTRFPPPAKTYTLNEVELEKVYKKDLKFGLFLPNNKCSCGAHACTVELTKYYIFWLCKLRCRRCQYVWFSNFMFTKKHAFYDVLTKHNHIDSDFID